MLVTGTNKDLEAKFTGTTVTLENNVWSHLSYYLNCVNHCLPGLIEDKLCKYDRACFFSQDEHERILHYCTELSPAVMKRYHLFVEISKYEMTILSGDHLNDFLSIQLTERIQQIAVVPEKMFFFEAKAIAVAQIMVFTSPWDVEHYYTPIRRSKVGVSNIPVTSRLSRVSGLTCKELKVLLCIVIVIILVVIVSELKSGNL